MDRLQARIEYYDLFCQKFGAFKVTMDDKVDYAKLQFESLEERSSKLIKAYGCNPEQVKPKDMFATLYEFAQDFSVSYKKLQAKIKAEEDKLKKAAAKKQSRSTVCEEDPKSVRELIEGWKALMAKASDLKDFGVKKKVQSEVQVVEVAKIVKKATRLSKSNVRGGSVVRVRNQSPSSSQTGSENMMNNGDERKPVKTEVNEEVELPDLGIEIVKTTYFKGNKTKTNRTERVHDSEKLGSQPAQYDVKIASREEVKQSLGIGKSDKPINLFKKRKSPPMSVNSDAPPVN